LFIREHIVILRIRPVYQVKCIFFKVLMTILLDILIIVNQFYILNCLFVNIL